MYTHQNERIQLNLKCLSARNCEEEYENNNNTNGLVISQSLDSKCVSLRCVAAFT